MKLTRLRDRIPSTGRWKPIPKDFTRTRTSLRDSLRATVNTCCHSNHRPDSDVNLYADDTDLWSQAQVSNFIDPLWFWTTNTPISLSCSLSLLIYNWCNRSDWSCDTWHVETRDVMYSWCVCSPVQNLSDCPQVSGVEPLNSSDHQNRPVGVQQRSWPSQRKLVSTWRSCDQTHLNQSTSCHLLSSCIRACLNVGRSFFSNQNWG